MDKTTEDRYLDLIEKAKEYSKERFLSFATELFNVNPSQFDHLWKIPIVASSDVEKVIPIELSEKDKNFINERVKFEGSLKDSYATYLNLSGEDEDLSSGFKDFLEDLSCIIVYDEELAKKLWKDSIEDNEKREDKKTIHELEESFIKKYSKIFTHERCHQNADTLVIDKEKEDDNKVYEKREIINGANIGLNDTPNFDSFYDFCEHNEVFIEFLARIIESYEEGKTLEDCIEKAVEKRKIDADKKQKTSIYYDFYDKSVLAMFVLFPNEMVEWGIFGAYDDSKRNVLKSKFEDIFDKDESAKDDVKVNKCINEYINRREEEGRPISEKQKKMISKLGLNLISYRDIKERTESDGISIQDMLDVTSMIKRVLDGEKIENTKENKKNEEGQDI